MVVGDDNDVFTRELVSFLAMAEPGEPFEAAVPAATSTPWPRRTDHGQE
jgi:hypothetical protein